MAGTRTASTVNGTPDFVRSSFRFIDAVGDVKSFSLIMDAAVTDAQIEAVAAAMQAGSNASLYNVEVTQVYDGTRAKSNAVNDDWISVDAHIVYHVKASPTSSQRAYMPAPVAANFVTDTEQPDTAAALQTAWYAAVLAAVGAAYDGVSVRFVETRDINEAVTF